MFQGTFGRPSSLRINYFNVLLTNFTLGVKVLGVYDNAFAGIALKCPWGVAENARGTFWKLVPINLASYKKLQFTVNRILFIVPNTTDTRFYSINS